MRRRELPTGLCPVCRTTHRLHPDGTLWAHGTAVPPVAAWDLGSVRWCAGSDRPALVPQQEPLTPPADAGDALHSPQ